MIIVPSSVILVKARRLANTIRRRRIVQQHVDGDARGGWRVEKPDGEIAGNFGSRRRAIKFALEIWA